MTYFDEYRVVKVNDDRVSLPGNYTPDVEYAVIGSNNVTVTDCGGWELPDQKVLFTTEVGPYDGGREACEGFIEGYKCALPQRMVETSVVSGCPISEGNDDEN
jgi:hypothetical protein